MTDHDQLERRLRAGRAPFDEVTIAPDAWQENQRRVAGARSRRLGWLLTAAAAVVVLLLVAGVSLLGGRGPDAGPPASGGVDDFWDPGNVLGPSVVAEQVTVDGEEVPHEIVLSDTTGEGPSLCDRIEASGSASGSCTSREPGADDEGVAFDWLSGSEGNGDVRGVLAGVDDRVSYVDVWMSDGKRLAAQLHPTGWEGTQMLALTVPSDGPRPQRLVASGRDGNVLQAVDLPSVFGDTWLVARSACAGDVVGQIPRVTPSPLLLGDTVIAVGTVDAQTTVREADGTVKRVCRRLASTSIAAVASLGGRSTFVVGPEVRRIQIWSQGVLGEQFPPFPLETAPYGVGSFGILGSTTAGVEIVALDAGGNVLDRAFVDQPRTP